jgi:hypothetical protein
MKILGALLGFVLVIAVGGFIYLSVADVHIEQTTVTKNIPVAAE